MFFLLLVQKKERNPPECTIRYGRAILIIDITQVLEMKNLAS